MANSNGIITAPVNLLADVKAVLGETSNNLSALCTSPKINPWARYKPVAYASFGSITDAQRLSVNYGFKIPTTVNSLLSQTWLRKDGRWLYAIPQGDANSPYRLGDFNGYFHNATHVMPSLPETQTVYVASNTSPLAIAINMPFLQTDGGTNKNIISPADFAPFGDGNSLADAYLGIYLTNGTNTVIRTNSERGLYVPMKISITPRPTGEYTAHLFASAQPITALTTDFNIKVCELYQNTEGKITFDSSTSADGWVIRLNGSLTPLYNASGAIASWQVNYSVTFISSSSRTFPNMQLYLLDANSVGANRLAYVTLGDVTATPSQPADFTGVFKTTNTIQSANTSLYVYIESTSDTKYKQGPIQCFIPFYPEPLNPDL